MSATPTPGKAYEIIITWSDARSCYIASIPELGIQAEGLSKEHAGRNVLAMVQQSIHETPSGTERDVCNDIVTRQQMGIAKYGTTVADNPLPLRDWLQHAYEETLDKAIYLKRAIAEIDKSTTP